MARPRVRAAYAKQGLEASSTTPQAFLKPYREDIAKARRQFRRRTFGAINKASALEIVTITEVGPRDGLQLITQAVPTAAKMQWIKALHAAGVQDIEVGSFVSPRLVHKWPTLRRW